ncbi:transmembrane and ubiquitin-like domain-containing protein 2 [Anopheles marshallii]|uniref:transmembrane and ubiquitin-like domain-containing protein 2 n=1 Tax=Anopheles marshallii TaxID=1521116 RepID=UPI00237A9624|nr:transmembrane and ubiquitin-like domain-containing protein 2 [Anopheles marshallii]
MLPFLDETDELFNYWILRVLVLIVIYLAWRSTYVREDRPNAAVLVIENNLGRLNSIQPHSVTTIILRSSSQQSNISNVTETEELDLENDSIASSIDNITQSILTEASESATGLDLSDTEGYPGVVSAPVVDTFNDRGPEEIIRQMDATDPEPIPNAQIDSVVSTGLRQRLNVTSTCAGQPEGEKSSDRVDSSTENTASASSTLTEPPLPTKPIRIKLKYLNDDSKLVEGNLNEGIGEFKRRNFTLELAAHKLVRLVFNGHVLQPDNKTLAACGLFDNCVVHCLIHNQKSALNGVSTDRPLEGSIGDNQNPAHGQIGGLENGDGIDTDGATDRRGTDTDNRSGTRYGTYFIYIGTLAVTAVILYGWYCRFHYGHLFNLNSTIGLIVTTTTFLIMMPTIILADSNTPN